MAAESQEAGSITPATSTYHKRKGAYALLKKRFKVALGCMVIRSQAELMIHRVQLLYSSSEPVTDGGRVIIPKLSTWRKSEVNK